MEQKSTVLSRLFDEQKVLMDRNRKLFEFIDSGMMDKVITDEYQKQMLKLQHRVMSRYIDILDCRIGRMNGAPEASLNFMSFGDALEVLRNGGAVRLGCWDEGTFVVKQVPSYVDETIIPKMQSLPQSAKNILLGREDKSITYSDQLLIVYPDGHADSWAPSTSDIFATNWEVVTE